MTNDIITLVANVALALSFLVGLVFGIFQVRVAARDRRERLTLEALRSFQTRDFAELMQFVNSYHLPSTREELASLPANEQVMFMQFAQQMEMLGILVADKYINIDLVERTLGSFVSTSWEKYSAVITQMRNILPDPFLAEYFQWLAVQMTARMKERPRKPVHETVGVKPHV